MTTAAAIRGGVATSPGAAGASLTPAALGVGSPGGAIFPIAPLGRALADLEDALGLRLHTAGRSRLVGQYYRGVRARYLQRTPPQPLYFAASLSGGRFTPPVWGPPALYLAADQLTVLAEVGDLSLDTEGRPTPRSAVRPLTLICADVQLDSVLNMTDRSTRKHLGVTLRQLRAGWRAPQKRWLLTNKPLAFTQTFGAFVHQSTLFQGMLVPSARYRYGVNLVVFPDRLTPGTWVRAVDDDGLYAQQLP